MARERKAPQHSLTAAMRVIPHDDSAWDHDRLNLELPELDKADDLEGKLAHPFMQYLHGVTRYDIDGTPGLLEYLDMSKKPEIWHIRRLKLDEAIRVDACSTDLEANALAFAFAVTKVENVDHDITAALADPKRSEVRIRRLAYDYSKDALETVGAAVRRASEDLREPEKKASGSPPGD